VKNQTDRVEHLLSVVKKLVNRYDDLEKRLESKSSVEAVSRLDDRLKGLEDRLTFSRSTEEKFVELEKELQHKNEEGDVDEDHRVSDKDMIKFVVQEEMNRKTAEEQDAEKRKRNIVIYRVPENKTDNVTERKANDFDFFRDLLDCVFNLKAEEDDTEKIYKLGRWSQGVTRPLLVSFKSMDMKESVVANRAKLKQTIDKFKGIGISHDMTPKVRQERKDMIEEAKREHESNNSDSVENYRFLVVGRGSRRKVIKIKKLPVPLSE